MAITSETIKLDFLPRYLSAYELSILRIPFKPSLQAISTYLTGQAKKRFQTATAPDGSKWAPLKNQRRRKRDVRAEKRKRSRARRGLKIQGGQKVLRDRDLLMGSMTAEGAGKAWTISDLSAMALRQGTNIPYGYFHQYGTKNKDGSLRMVARKFAGFSKPKDPDKIAQIVLFKLTGKK